MKAINYQTISPMNLVIQMKIQSKKLTNRFKNQIPSSSSKFQIKPNCIKDQLNKLQGTNDKLNLHLRLMRSPKHQRRIMRRSKSQRRRKNFMCGFQTRNTLLLNAFQRSWDLKWHGTRRRIGILLGMIQGSHLIKSSSYSTTKESIIIQECMRLLERTI